MKAWIYYHELKRKEDSAFTTPFTCTTLESLLQNDEKSAEEPRVWYLEYFLYFYCITCVILFGSFNFNSPSLRYDENHSARTQNTITTFLKF